MGTKNYRRGIGLVAAGLLVAVLAGCGGNDGAAGPAGEKGDKGDPGVAGAPGPAGGAGVVSIGSNSTAPTEAAKAAWTALAPQVTVTGVTIASQPEVSFTVKDADGRPVLGLGNKSKSSSTAVAASYTNLSFSIAKLVPGTNGSPSKWVNYIVTTMPTYKKAQPDPGGDTSQNPPGPTRPTTDNTGTLDDNGDGTYKYTFFRDIKEAKNQLAAVTTMTDADKIALGGDKDLSDLVYTPDSVHRLTIQLSGNAPGTGTNTPTGTPLSPAPAVALPNPYDAIYDFVPATGQPAASGREIVATAKCNECHRKLGGIPGDDPESSAAQFHGGNRNEVRYCVVCHTEQRKWGRTEASINAATLTFVPTPPSTTISTNIVDGRALGNMPNNIHKIHMGKFLAKKKYNYAGVEYNEVAFPQDIRNCTKCHDGGTDTTKNQTAQGDNWMNVPSRLACGACHDGINFTTGAGVKLADAMKGTLTNNANAHPVGPQPDDAQCVLCHGPGKTQAVALFHIPVTPPNLKSALHVAGGSANTNSAWIASGASIDRLPPGAIKVSYDIKSVSRNAAKQPVMEFRILQNGARKDLNVFNPANPIGTQEIWDNFMGSPSVQFVYAVPQDGLATPADFNGASSVYLKRIWQGGAGSPGTLTGPDPNGYYIATITNVTIPNEAVMLTGGLGYSYNVSNTLPLTQTNLTDFPVPDGSGLVNATATNKTGGLIVIAPNAQKIASAGCIDASSPLRGVCAASNGAAAATGSYVGRRQIVEDARCNKCHQELGTFTEEAFHGGQRNDGTTCAWCHTPNRTSSAWSADSTSFVHAIHAGAKRKTHFTWHAVGSGPTGLEKPFESFAEIGFPGVLKECEACHLPGTYDFSSTTNATNSAGATVAANASANAVLNKQYRTVGQGIYNGTAGTTITTYSVVAGACVAGTSPLQNELNVFSLSPYIVPLTNYGIGFSYNAGPTTSTPSCKPDGTLVTNPAGGTLQADPTTLVISPITAACFSCHDSAQAKAHIESNGGSIYAPRSVALGKTETCLVCHETGRIADIRAMHAK